MNDNEILKLLLDKDDTALSELKNAYQHYCFSIAFNILHNYEDAEECVSDTWLRVWNSVPPNHPASLKRYSARITRNLALNRYRDLRTQKCGNGILCHSIEELSECISDGVNIEDIFSRDEIRILFQQFIHKAKDRHNSTREQILKRFQRERSKSTTISVNRIMADIHELNDLNRDILDQPDSILRAAEHLSFGSLIPDGIDKLLFSHSQIPWIMPFLGHQNLLLESNGDACQALALQFAVAALKQTAAGQLSLTVINPNLRATFSSLSTLPDFRMLTR